MSEGVTTGAPRHAAVLYESDDDLRCRSLPFMREGLAAGETVVAIVSEGAADALRDGLGDDHRGVLWELPNVSYASLGLMFSGFRSYLAQQSESGNRVRLLAENPAVDHAGRTAAYLRFEAASNDVLGAFGCTWACLYDRRRHDDGLLDRVGQVHPLLVASDGGLGDSAAYLAPDAYLEAHPGPLSPVPHHDVPLDTWLTSAAELPSARHRAVATADGLGLPADDLEDFELAAAEVLSNAVRHGEQPCRLRLWTTPSHIVLRVDDQGPGDDLPTKGFRPPDAAHGHLGGMGMWIIRQLADVVHVETGRAGTAVEIQFRTSGP